MNTKYFTHLSTQDVPPVYFFFDGEKWVPSRSGKTKEILSPVDGKSIGFIQVVSIGEIDEAIRRAKNAQIHWQSTPMTVRIKKLHLVADWMREHEKLLTTMLIKEIGKPYKEAQDEILRSADMIDYFTHEALHIHGEELSGDTYPGYDQTKIALIERIPLGVILAISPFNYPVNLSVSKIAPALVTGNAVIFKPSTQGSVIALHLIEIFRMAGIPDGILSIITGTGDEIGKRLTTHPDIKMITFTGSTKVGKTIATNAGMIPLLFECGGNNPAIVLPDANMEETASEIVNGAFAYSGQRCTAIKYIMGLSPTIDTLLPLVIKKTQESIKMGNPHDLTNNFGPLISNNSADEVEIRIFKAKADGATIVYGGKREGRYIEATILDRVKTSMEIIQKETFGPIVGFLRVRSIEETVEIIKHSEYGLQASIFTSDEGSGMHLAKILDVGTIQINARPQRGPDHFPFFGIKGSGIGIQGIRYTLNAMTRPHTIVLNKPQ